MGCNPIIVIGQNLSFPNLESYADGAVLKTGTDRHIQQCVENSNKYYVLEKDIDGNDVYTTHSMLSIRFYFEEYIKNHPDRLYLNGSEEGLPIKGMKNMPLKEIVESTAQRNMTLKEFWIKIQRRI